MATSVRPITPDELTRLQELAEADYPVTSRRARCVLLSAEGKTTAEIGKQIGVSERSARNAVVAFNTRGTGSLPKAIATGRPRRFDGVATEVLQETMAASPREYGFGMDYWSLDALAQTLGEKLATPDLRADTLAREIRRRGLVWTREKRAAPHISRPATMAEGKRRMVGLQDDSSGSGGRVYADLILSPGEEQAYIAVIENLRSEFQVCGGIEEMHIQLAASYLVKLSQAQNSGDWNKVEVLDRMLERHLSELRAAKRRQDAESEDTGGDSPAEWATELLERAAAAEAAGTLAKDDGAAPGMTSEEAMELMDRHYAEWRKNRSRH
jgi:transposase